MNFGFIFNLIHIFKHIWFFQFCFLFSKIIKHNLKTVSFIFTILQTIKKKLPQSHTPEQIHKIC
jgi:hypothetical protein